MFTLLQQATSLTRRQVLKKPTQDSCSEHRAFSHTSLTVTTPRTRSKACQQKRGGGWQNPGAEPLGPAGTQGQPHSPPSLSQEPGSRSEPPTAPAETAPAAEQGPEAAAPKPPGTPKPRRPRQAPHASPRPPPRRAAPCPSAGCREGTEGPRGGRPPSPRWPPAPVGPHLVGFVHGSGGAGRRLYRGRRRLGAASSMVLASPPLPAASAGSTALPHTPRAALAPLAALTGTAPGCATAEGGHRSGGEGKGKEGKGKGEAARRRGGLSWDGSRAGPSGAESLVSPQG